MSKLDKQVIFKIKRIYEKPAKGDGYSILVDRLWPRGLKKEDAALDCWLKEIAPSVALRKWFDHQPERWADFSLQYKEELAKNPAVAKLLEKTKTQAHITLLYAAHSETYNHAQVLLGFLEEQLMQG